MDDLNRSICQFLKDGHYYNDARNWFANKYILAASERAYVCILCLIFICFSIIILGFYGSINPALDQPTYLHLTNDISKTYSLIADARDRTYALNSQEIDRSPQNDVNSYLLAKYVITRERYKFGQITDSDNYIKNTSVNNEYLKYHNQNSINNEFSPELTYQDKFRRDISITKIKHTKLKQNINSAVVYFKASEVDLTSNKISDSYYRVSVTYQVDDINQLLISQSNNLNFIVTDYRLEKDKLEKNND